MATEARKVRASRQLELMELREEIIHSRELAEEKEWKAEILLKERQLERNRRLIDKKKQELYLKEMEEKQMQELNQLEEGSGTGVHEAGNLGQIPTDYVNSQVNERSKAPVPTIEQQQVTCVLFREDKQVKDLLIAEPGAWVEDWVSKHSHSHMGIHDDLQKRANKIMQQKKLTRLVKDSLKSRLRSSRVLVSEEDTDQEELYQPTTSGIGHFI